MTPEKADATMKGDCLFFGAMLVRLGAVDGMVAGSACPTANVLRAALQVVGTKLYFKQYLLPCSCSQAKRIWRRRYARILRLRRIA